MADEKKYTAKEAGLAVLKKFDELIKKEKSKEHKHIGWNKLHSKLEGEGYSKESADKIAGSIKAKVNKSEENPDKEADAKLGEKVEQDVEQHMHENKEAEQKEGHVPWDKSEGVKGHIKLAKFMGILEGKRNAKQMPDSGNSEPTKEIHGVGAESPEKD